MATFPLHDLPLILLEQILTKLDLKEYIRLQQTCRFMEELIRTSRKIRVSWRRNALVYRMSGNSMQMTVYKGKRRFELEKDGCARTTAGVIHSYTRKSYQINFTPDGELEDYFPI